MTERDLPRVQQHLYDIVGFRARAEISAEGAIRSAGIIIDIEDAINMEATEPIDLFNAIIATSQLVERWGQIQYQWMLGYLSSVDDCNMVRQIQKRKHGTHSTQEDTELRKEEYVARPAYAANKAMEVLTKLQTIYPDIPLKKTNH